MHNASCITSTGVAIVTTPQDIALLDARRGAEMFRKVDTQVWEVGDTQVWEVGDTQVWEVGVLDQMAVEGGQSIFTLACWPYRKLISVHLVLVW